MTVDLTSATCVHCGESTASHRVYIHTDAKSGKVREVCRLRDLDRRSEKAIQAEIVKNLRALGYFVSTTSQAQRAQMTAGIVDVIAMHPRHGIAWIEVKRPTRRNTKHGGCSPDQLAWHAAARECGQTVIVAYGWGDVADELARQGVIAA